MINALVFAVIVGMGFWVTIKCHDDDDGQWFD